MFNDVNSCSYFRRFSPVLSSDITRVAKAKFENVAPKCTRTIIPAWKAIVEDIRSLIVNKIILDGGDSASGIFNGKFTDIARSLNVSSAVVSNVRKRFCTEGENLQTSAS